MTPASPHELSIIQRIDAVCDRFEEEFASGRRPRLEDYLADVEDPIRVQLFRELLELDLELRRAAGELPQCDEYSRRFEPYTSLIEVVFRELSAGPGRRQAARVARDSSMKAATAETSQLRARPASPAAEPSWTQVGRFRIDHKLGEGAFGAVYKARDPQLDRDVAVKIPHDRALAAPDDRDRFLREARAAGGLHHPHICPVYEVGATPDGRDYIVMAFIDGKPLSKVVKSSAKLTDRQIASVIRKLALEEAHQQGVIHRDLKPANIMINRKGEPVIMDFGLARRSSAADAQISFSGQIMGTPAYMSPEQARGDSKLIGPAADIYSLGVVLYELLCGQRPFSGTVTEVIGAILHLAAPPPSHYRAGVDPQLQAICLKAIAKRPEDRYASMKDFAAALTEYLKGGSTASLAAPESAPLSAFAALAEAVAAEAGSEPQPAPRTVSRKPAAQRFAAPLWGYWAGAGVLGAALLLGVFFFVRSSKITQLVILEEDVSDPALTFALDGRRLDAQALSAPIELTPGVHLLDIQKDGQFFKQYKVTAVKGQDRAAIDVVQVATPAAEPAAPPLAASPTSAAPPLAIAPFSPQQARQLQQAWAQQLDVPLEWTNSLGMKFVLIPPGEYTLGTAPDQIEKTLALGGARAADHVRTEQPARRVRIAQPLYFGVHEVTKGAFARFAELSGYKSDAEKDGQGAQPELKTQAGLACVNWREPGFEQTENHPVVNVSGTDLLSFCDWLSRAEGYSYRLPREAEWEYACRAGTTTLFYGGDDQQAALQLGNMSGALDGFEFTAPVGSFPPNPFGLYDMHGNVWEICRDFSTPNYAGHDSAGEPPKEIQGSDGVSRGGGGDCPPAYCRSAVRSSGPRQARCNNLGFRIVCEVTEHFRPQGAVASTPGGWRGWPADAPQPAVAPFDAEQARRHQDAWAQHLGVPVEFTNSIGMRLRLIPPGEFLRGSTPAEIESALRSIDPQQPDWETWLAAMENQGPQHKVVLTRPIYLGVFEVTQKEYQTVTGKNPAVFAKAGRSSELERGVAGLDTSSHPVDSVSWHDAVEFCAKLSQLEKRHPLSIRPGESVALHDEGDGYRLPTQAEREFACRAGITSTIWTDEDLARVAWVDSNGEGTHVVGQLPANPFGLHDMHGNVWEWCSDWYDPKEYQQFVGRTIQNPQGPASGTHRVLGGGSWRSRKPSCWSAYREPQPPKKGGDNMGFRVVLVLPAAAGGPSRTTASGPTPSWRGWPADAPPPAIVPFTAEQAQAHQQAWARHLGAPVEHTNSVGMKFRLIPPGGFSMGSTREEIIAALGQVPNDKAIGSLLPSEEPKHWVVLTQPFYVGVHEVTQAHYAKVMGKNPASGADQESDSHPVHQVSWSDAVEFCAKLSQLEQRSPYYQKTTGIEGIVGQGEGDRLPTEAEWEFACRAGTTTNFWRGDAEDQLLDAGWFMRNAQGRRHAVGQLRANPFGLYDMHGNVWEWCYDWLNVNEYQQYATKMAIDPSGPGPDLARWMRVHRGGGWSGSSLLARSAQRSGDHPDLRNMWIGFRTVLTVGAVRQATQPEHSAAPASAGWTQLFNGTDLTGWKTISLKGTKDPSRKRWVARPQERVLEALGEDYVDLETEKTFRNFTLRLEWRFTPGGKSIPNGSGIVVRTRGLTTSGPVAGFDPKGIEIDLRPNPGSANKMGTGCLIAYGTPLENASGKVDGVQERHLNRLQNPVLAPGDGWNAWEITCAGDRITVTNNGAKVSEAWGAEDVAGGICLRNQKSAVQFRNLRVRELPDPPTKSPADDAGK